MYRKVDIAYVIQRVAELQDAIRAIEDDLRHMNARGVNSFPFREDCYIPHPGVGPGRHGPISIPWAVGQFTEEEACYEVSHDGIERMVSFLSAVRDGVREIGRDEREYQNAGVWP